VLSDMTAFPTDYGETRIQEDPAFEAMVTRESRRLWILALSILRDDGEAEDAVQDVLLKAWRSRQSLGDIAATGPWLTRVLINHCISRRRHLQIRGLWGRRPLHESTAAALPGTPSGDLVDADRAYRHLSSRQRAAISLNYWHGYSIEECAEIMGCRPGTVRSHLARGWASLHKELGDG
jgi:RNA polymerase sigma-70 factor, ECF subfamily